MTVSTTSRAHLQDFAALHRSDFERWLADLVNIPSVSVDPSHATDVRHCAETARDLLRQVGAQSADLIETDGHPMVHARLTAEHGWPTVTVYNHLDVQPADGDDWRTDPFHLTTEADRYIGRGATDDKGPAMSALLGALAARQAGGLGQHRVPVGARGGSRQRTLRSDDRSASRAPEDGFGGRLGHHLGDAGQTEQPGRPARTPAVSAHAAHRHH